MGPRIIPPTAALQTQAGSVALHKGQLVGVMSYGNKALNFVPAVLQLFWCIESILTPWTFSQGCQLKQGSLKHRWVIACYTTTSAKRD